MAERNYISRGSGKGLPAFEHPDAVAQGLTNPLYAESIRIDAADHSRLYVAGCTGTDYRRGEVAGPDLASQAAQAMKNTLEFMGRAGATGDDIVRLRVYLTEDVMGPDGAREATDAVSGFLDRDAMPSMSITGIRSVVRATGNIEIEADAILVKKDGEARMAQRRDYYRGGKEGRDADGSASIPDAVRIDFPHYSQLYMSLTGPAPMVALHRPTSRSRPPAPSPTSRTSSRPMGA